MIKCRVLKACKTFGRLMEHKIMKTAFRISGMRKCRNFRKC